MTNEQNTSSLESLLAALRDSRWQVQQQAVRDLIALNDKRAIEPLIALMVSPNQPLRENAAVVLRALKAEQVAETLVTRLADADYKTRESAIIALGEWGDQLAVPYLILMLADKHNGVCYTATDVLDKLADKRVAKPLIEILQNPQWNIKEIKGAIVRAFGMIDLDWFNVTKSWLLYEIYPRLRQCATHLLGKFGDGGATDVLIALLKTKDRFTKGQAVGALIRLEMKQAITPLIQMLQDESWETRYDAARALSGFKDQSVLEALLTALAYEQDDRVHRAIVLALGELGYEQAIDLLIKVLQEQPGAWSYGVAELLGKLGDTRAVPALIHMLETDTSAERHPYIPGKSVAAEALAKLKDFRAFEALVKACQDEDESVRLDAIRSLGRLGDSRAFEVLMRLLQDKDIEMQSAAISGLGYLGDKRALELLIPFLKHEEWWVSENTVEALGDLQDERAVEPLLDELMNKGTEVRLGCEVLKALGKIGSRLALPTLTWLEQNTTGTIQAEAVKAIAQIQQRTNKQLG